MLTQQDVKEQMRVIHSLGLLASNNGLGMVQCA